MKLVNQLNIKVQTCQDQLVQVEEKQKGLEVRNEERSIEMKMYTDKLEERLTQNMGLNMAKLTKRIDDLKSELLDEIHQIHDRITNLDSKITEEAKVAKLPPPKVFKRATYDGPVTFFNDSILIGT